MAHSYTPGLKVLKNTKIFQKPVSVKKIMNELDFIKRKDKYGLY